MTPSMESNRRTRRPRNIGHRGAAGHCAENTLRSFRTAMDLGADGVELDVRETRDGVFVVHHDDRLAGRRIADLTRDEIMALAVAGDPPGPPTLDETLDLMSGYDRPTVLVEIKALRNFPAYLEMIARRRAALDLYTISFDGAILEALRRLDRDIVLGLLLPPRGRYTPEDVAAFNLSLVLPEHGLLDADLVRQCRDDGVLVYVWTVDAVADIARCRDLDADGIISDYPDRVGRIIGTSPPSR